MTNVSQQLVQDKLAEKLPKDLARFFAVQQAEILRKLSSAQDTDELLRLQGEARLLHRVQQGAEIEEHTQRDKFIDRLR